MKSVFTFDDGLVLAGIVGVSPAQPAGEARPIPVHSTHALLIFLYSDYFLRLKMCGIIFFVLSLP